MITRIACGTTTRRSVVAGAQPERACRLRLALRDRQDAGPHDLGDEGGRVGDEPEEQRHELGEQLHAAAEVEAPAGAGRRR